MKIIQHDFRQSTRSHFAPNAEDDGEPWWDESNYVGRPSMTRAIAVAVIGGLLGWWAMYELLCWAFSS